MLEPARALTSYRLLGRSGLRVSPLALGTMTFGMDWGWGADAQEARRVFDAYVDKGGNFIDTAVNYTNGTSERLVGEFMKEKRERLVIATKFTMLRQAGNPNSGGNHRLNMMRSVETSLQQLATDRIDLLYMHAWDFTTAPDEVMRSLDDLVRAGKVVYVAISNTPAWRVAQMQTLADLRGWAPLVAMQIEYNLIERSVEQELMPMAAALGLGVVPWSPLASGLLSGKYNRTDFAQTERTGASVMGTRKDLIARAGILNERTFAIVDAVRDVAREIGASPSQVSLAWSLLNPTVTSTIIGARTLAQLEDNLGALTVSLSQPLQENLQTVSAPQAIFPYSRLPMSRNLIFGGLEVSGTDR